MVSAYFATIWARYSRGTTRFTSPIWRAVGASMVSPVRSISMACLLETLRDSATMGVEQNSPILTPGVEKAAWSEAIARSQLATSWQPAAEAGPSTSAMTGFGSRTMVCMRAAHRAHRGLEEAAPPIGVLAVARSFP